MPLITVRRAVKILSDLGIVETIPGKGTRVLVGLDNPAPLSKFTSPNLKKALLQYLQSMQIILINSARAIWGVDPYPFPQIFSIRPIKFGPVRVLPQSIGIIGVAAVVVIILQCFYKFTKTGQSMTAAATSPKAAMMLGINVAKTRNLTFTISAMLACISAILVSPMYNVYPEMGASVGTKGFCAAVIGGFGSIPAALVGGILLGIIESLVSGVLSAAYRDIIAFIIMILILYLKPAGLLGKKVEQKF